MDARQAFGLTTPLLATASGEKMGKTVGGAVWLNADRLSPYDYWQMWRNTEDADVGRFLKLFTELPLAEIARLEALRARRSTRPRRCWPTRRRPCCTAPRPRRRRRTRRGPRSKQGRLSEDLPTYEVPRSELEAGIPLATIAADAGLASSRGEARRLAQGGGLRVNDVAETDGQRVLTLADAMAEGMIKLAAGRKKIVLVRVGVSLSTRASLIRHGRARSRPPMNRASTGGSRTVNASRAQARSCTGFMGRRDFARR